MGYEGPWVVWILAVVGWALAIGGLACNGITQISTRGPGFLPFERWFRRRRPATEGDFVLQGAVQVLQALGLTLVAAPLSFMGLLATMELTTGWHPPSVSEVPFIASSAVLVVYAGSLVIGFFCVAYAYLIGTKVNYVRLDVGVGRPA